MNEKELRTRMQQNMPEVPENFHRAMENTLNRIVCQEQADPVRALVFRPRRALALALAIALLLGTVAFAAYRWQIFDTLSLLTSENPKNADRVMQADLAHTNVNGVDIAVTEAGYDGRILFLRYSYRLPGFEESLGVYENGQLKEGLLYEEDELLSKYNVGWWTDNFWIDGLTMEMFSGSGGVTTGSDVPGEIIVTEYWRLDAGAVRLSGEVDISLPIGAKPDTSKYFPLFEHPEWKDENGNFKMPDEGLVTFTLDTGDMLDQVVTEHPNLPVELPEVTAKVTEAAYSPLMTYITLDLQGNPDAWDAFEAEHGEGWTDEDGNVIMPYTAMDVHGDWVCNLHLVDGNGAELFPGEYACSGYGDDWAEYLYPYIESLPDELYLAPIENGAADFSRAVRVR
ncbi:MAG: hypothetical protein IKU70_02150 [Clostridia bacterium]|nr:hypothetical protein [Clostridia bacterium]